MTQVEFQTAFESLTAAFFAGGVPLVAFVVAWRYVRRVLWITDEDVDSVGRAAPAADQQDRAANRRPARLSCVGCGAPVFFGDACSYCGSHESRRAKP